MVYKRSRRSRKISIFALFSITTILFQNDTECPIYHFVDLVAFFNIIIKLCKNNEKWARRKVYKFEITFWLRHTAHLIL